MDRSIFVIALGLAVLAALPYLARGGLDSFIIFDDEEYITKNPIVLRGLSPAGLRWAFTTFHTANWHPLTWLSHMLDASLFGLDARGHHATNILLHAVSTILLFVVLRRLTGARWRAVLVAALFAVHPLHVESVAWVSERKDVLSGVFFMLLLLAYQRYASSRSAAAYLVVAAILALGLMAKPMLVTAPAVLLLLDYWPLGRLQLPAGGGPVGWPRLLAEKGGLLVMSAVSGTLTLAAQSTGGSMLRLDVLPLSARIANAVVSTAAYLGDTFWPADLAVYYPHPVIAPRGQVAGATLLITALGAIAIRTRRRRPFLTVGALWFAGMLLPVIGLIQVGHQARADRYMYLPLTGVLIAVVWAASALFGAHRRGWAAAAAIASVAAYAAAATAQVGYWKNSESLFRRAAAVTEGNYLAHSYLGGLLATSGRSDEAVAELRTALEIWPFDARTQYTLAGILVARGQRREAVEHYRRALDANPAFYQARNNLGVTLMELGDLTAAETEFRVTLRTRPDDAIAHFNLASILDRTTRFQEAALEYREVLRTQPDDAPARDRLRALDRMQPPATR